MKMSRILKNIFLAVLLFTAAGAQAQGEIATLMRSNGKIYVVVAVMLIILIGIAIYLFTLDRKISRLEKNKKEEQK